MNPPDPYKTLQVDPEAEDEVIEAAYRRLARKYHPDVAPGPDAQDRMVRINQAWEVLRDPVKRAAVDRARMRSTGAAARVHAADARAAAQAASQAARERAATSTQRDSPQHGTQGRRPEPASQPYPEPPPAWGFPGVYEPDPRDFRARPQFVSTDWTPGRSTAGHAYDPGSMRLPQGEGAAGAPPGNPSGSVLNFGRYVGWSLGEIARTDLEYLEWLDRTPIGRPYQAEIDALLRSHRRRVAAPAPAGGQRGLFRRR